ncbi:hypothetical protein PILCRDRAFT_339430 [Piloderma croceum F 1598]|uniref:F-box domain-containing protein n=1 Tax=Piloderma croceum (strain F 1598) TaxID=765440 RepID=A0A0C3C7I3_PILCF|nr:hypothetical protein PILCRDRAFT_339430 [Piloderma croceum F 1598]
MITSEAAVNKGKGTGSGRKFGKLAQLMNMPLDVFFEITGHLEPLDILRLSRVSKQFRVTFASKHSRHIWLTARRNIHMPECPSDLTELQFASLMFEQYCQVRHLKSSVPICSHLKSLGLWLSCV